MIYLGMVSLDEARGLIHARGSSLVVVVFFGHGHGRHEAERDGREAAED